MTAASTVLPHFRHPDGRYRKRADHADNNAAHALPRCLSLCHHYRLRAGVLFRIARGRVAAVFIRTRPLAVTLAVCKSSLHPSDGCP